MLSVHPAALLWTSRLCELGRAMSSFGKRDCGVIVGIRRDRGVAETGSQLVDLLFKFGDARVGLLGALLGWRGGHTGFLGLKTTLARASLGDDAIFFLGIAAHLDILAHVMHKFRMDD